MAKLPSEVLFYNIPYNLLGFTSFLNYPHCAKQLLFHSLISNEVPKTVFLHSAI